MKSCPIELDPSDPVHPDKDQFFVLGDNSAQSSDGRLWKGEYWVDRELLIGKALFIYWPHGWASSVRAVCQSHSQRRENASRPIETTEGAPLIKE